MERLAYSVKESAEMIGCSQRTIVREIQRGRLSVIRVGRLVRIPAESLRIYSAIPNGTKQEGKENEDASQSLSVQPQS